MALIVVGSANMDLVVRTERFPVPGETVMGISFSTFPGGKGANQAVAAAMLGAEVFFVGCVGSDSFGASLRSSLQTARVRCDYLATSNELPSGVASITVDGTGQNTIVVAPGANTSVTAQQALRVLDAHPGSTLLIQLEIPIGVVCEIVESRRSARTILNPAPALTLPSDLYPCIDVLTPNESEAQALTGVHVDGPESAAQAASILLGRGTRDVVITLGSLGCYHANRSSARYHPAFTVEPIDTVAAGDAFSGALACFLDAGEDMGEAIRLAGVAAALSTTRHGAQASMPTLAEVHSASPVE